MAVQILIILVTTVGAVKGQVDMFSLHDSQRGDVSMHVTRESAQIEAIADSVSLEMNPQGAPGGGFARSINNNTHGGYTIGNIDQSQLTMKEDNSKSVNTANDRSDAMSHSNHIVDHLKEQANHLDALSSLPRSNKFIHIAQDDFNVRRSELPILNVHKRSLSKRGGKKYKRHSRPRPPCNDDVMATRTLIKGDRFDIIGDFNEIMEKSARRKRSSRRKRSTKGKTHEKRSSGDTRREGELYNIHDGVLNPLMESRSCVSTPVEGNTIPARSEIKAIREVRSLTEDGSERKKKSGLKTMKIHNELGGMHIKSDPRQTAVVSESGNIEITMLNDQESSTAKKHERGDVRNNIQKNKVSSQQYESASSRTLQHNKNENNLRPKVRLHLAQDVSLKRYDINVNDHGNMVVVA